ncbi:MAG TPA: PIN domain-containing protein [Microbacteriaceae bacterium]|nr:PIN domain-containing protein [Microbacteriaceae bacterium]
MIIADSSAWIEYTRGRRSACVDALDAALDQGLVATCEPVWAEVIAGALDDREQSQLERMLGALPLIPTEFADWENAATIRRASRRQGRTVRSLLDCLIAGVAMHHGATVLHNDSDFEQIAEVFPTFDQTRG